LLKGVGLVVGLLKGLYLLGGV
jgi:hypothetical protein